MSGGCKHNLDVEPLGAYWCGEVTCPPKTGPDVNSETGLKERGQEMPRKSYTPEQIIGKLREVELLVRYPQKVCK